MDSEVKEKVLVVTGSADGIGLAMVNSFLDKGVKLAVILDINENKGNENVATLKKKYGDDRVVFYKCNVLTDLDTIYQTVISNYKNVDILVNNAGVANEKSITNTIDVNTTAVMEWTMKFYEHMRKDKGGKGGTIINVSSIYGHRIIPFIPIYHGSKFAVLGFSKSLGDEYNFKKSSVRVVTLCPGMTITNIGKNPCEGEDYINPDFETYLKTCEWQTPDYVGNGAVEIFEKAESGSVWIVEGERPAHKWNV